MKRLLICLFVMALSGAAWGSESLLAPVYPGAVGVDEAREQIGGNRAFGGTPAQRSAFLVRDDPDSVADWYARQGFTLGEARRSRLGGLGAELRTHEILDQAQTASRLEDYTMARSAGIQLVWPRPRESGVYFGALRDSVAKGHHSQAELDRVAAEFGWLESCVFSAVQTDDGQWLPADQALTERYYRGQQAASAGAALDMDQLGRQIQELMAEGRMEEAQALMQQLSGSLGAMEDTAEADSWAAGMELLRKLEQKAYRAVLLIDRVPEHWESP